jgi:hypothetical protein
MSTGSLTSRCARSQTNALGRRRDVLPTRSRRRDVLPLLYANGRYRTNLNTLVKVTVESNGQRRSATVSTLRTSWQLNGARRDKHGTDWEEVFQGYSIRQISCKTSISGQSFYKILIKCRINEKYVF